MYNTNLVTLTETLNGTVAIETPFNREFVNELKAIIPSAHWTGSKWLISILGKEQVEVLLAKYYPAEDQYQTVQIEWDLNRDNPQIDGVSLASISRDYWNWRRNCPIAFKVIEQELESGGSRKNPGLYGRLVIEAHIRPGATFSPAPDEITVLEESQAPNPLADFSDDDLIAELTRRGYKVAK